MPQFIKVATTDELADDQAKLDEVEDQKGCPVSCGRRLQMRRLLGSADAPESAECPHGSLMPGLTMQRAVGRVYVRVTSLTLVAYCSVQGSMSNAKIHGVRTGSSGQDPQADHGTAIGSREASDPNALRSGRAG
jgi:hypothetical protein